MAAGTLNRNKTLRLLLKELKDPVVQENFYKLKLFLEDIQAGVTNITTIIDAGGQAPSAAESPKLIQTFDTDSTTAVGDLLKVTGTNFVSTITDNTVSEIPKGIFGVAFDKPTIVTVDAIFIGILGGYSGFTTGAALFVDTDGTLTHTAPSTGMVQQVGFAVSTTECFFYMQQAFRRS